MRASHHRRKRTLLVLRAKCLQDTSKTRYLLLQAKSTAAFYVLAARHGEAGQRALVGHEAEKAAALFTLLWQHAVSPCHVAAVVFDFCE